MLPVMCLVTTFAGNNQLTLRLLNHWDNPNGTIERGFSGSSIWVWEAIPADTSVALPDSLLDIYNAYGRTNQMLGINGAVLNNVNAKPLMLNSEMLQKVRRIADVLRPYGIKVYLSVNFGSPKALGFTTTADPLDTGVIRWWHEKCKEILGLIPDFGGFLVKANSEGEPGPMDYGRTHVDGANMLADAFVDAYNAKVPASEQRKAGNTCPIIMWRAFVYAPGSEDRASQAYNEFIPYDGKFRENVIIQIKNGPVDFQPREPLSPLFFALKHTKMMAELQITQEYTGHNIATCFLGTEWKEFIDSINAYKIPLEGFAGVSNIGDQTFKKVAGTGGKGLFNEMTRVNWYAFGMLANDTTTTPETIARTYLENEWSRDERFLKPITELLLDSYETYVSYTMPLGLHHIFAGNHHYGPEPWYFVKGLRADWLPPYYHKADEKGLGFDRTVNGSGNVMQYPEPLRSLYGNAETCPDYLKLWFHHVPWSEIWDKLCHTYDKGVSTAQTYITTWESVKPYVDPDRYTQQLRHFQQQADDAWWWRDACLLYFQEFSKLPFPADSPAPKYELGTLRRFHINIDNYTQVPMAY